MKRTVFVVAALIASLALGSVIATAKTRKGKATVKAGSTISISYTNNSTDPLEPYSPSIFEGKVGVSKVKVRTRRVHRTLRKKAKGKISRLAKVKCKRGRRVVVEEAAGTRAGSSRTGRRGDYTVSVDSNLSQGTYSATALRKKLRLKRKVRRGRKKAKITAKVTCKPATSPSVIVG